MHTDTSQTVSVLIPAFNHERYVKQCIESVLNQTHQDVELLFCDDASVDQTYAKAMALKETSQIKMKVFRNEKNRGICATLNFLLSHAEGNWVSLLASDDFYYPDFIKENLKNTIKTKNEIIAVHSAVDIVNENGEVIETSKRKMPPIEQYAFKKKVLRSGHVYAPTFFTSKKVYDLIGGFDETLLAEDLDLHLRVARLTDFTYIPTRLMAKRVVQGGLGQHAAKWNDDIFKAIEKHVDAKEIDIWKVLRKRFYFQIERAFFDNDLPEAVRLNQKYAERYRAHLVISVLSALKGVFRRIGRIVKKKLREAFLGLNHNGGKSSSGSS